MSLQTALVVAFQTFTIYIVLVLAVSIFSKRQRGQLNAVDLLVMLMLGSAVETAMVQASTSLKVGLVSATTLLLANKLLGLLALKSPVLRRFLNNPPIVLVSDGRLVPSNCRRAGLTEADVLQGVRSRGEAGLETVRYAVLECDGVISVVPR
jgi:uncharacterized membrane protein YcaP (DUF421 family)